MVVKLTDYDLYFSRNPDFREYFDTLTLITQTLLHVKTLKFDYSLYK